MAKLIVKIKAL